MSWIQTKELQEQIYAKTKEARSMIERAEKENRKLSDSEQTGWDQINREISAYEARLSNLKALDELEKRANVKTESRVEEISEEDRAAKDDKEHRASFNKYLRTGERDARFESRDMGVGSLAVGPRGFNANVYNVLKVYTGVLDAGATVDFTDTGTDYARIKWTDTSNTGELVAENTTTNSQDATQGNVIMKAYKYSSKGIAISMELLQDAGYDVEGEVTKVAGARIGRILNTHLTTGDDSSKPQGFIVGATAGKTAASATTFTADELIDLFHSVDPAYRKDPTFSWQWNDTVMAHIRKLKDSQNRYLLEPGLNGQPSTVLGRPWTINNDMASAFTTGQKLVSIGAWSSYAVRIVRGVQMMRSDHVNILKGQTVFVAWMRADGRCLDTTAIKYLQLA